jgi:hypothetical protein
MKKVTPEHIARIIADSKLVTTKLGAKTTCVTATLPNGFEIVATSACVDPANYDEALGRNLCIKRIQRSKVEARHEAAASARVRR